MIIIKTPQPDVEERLVLVPPESCTPVFDDGKPAGLSIRAQGARDATPADLERAGWVPVEETRADGSVVPVRRWENGIRAIASLFIGPRDEFEISEIVARVKKSEHERAGLAEAANEAYDERDKERARAEKAEHERDEARRDSAEQARHKHDSHVALYKVVRERDTLRAELADAKAERDRAIRDCAATAAERNEARAEVARLGVAHERAHEGSCRDSLEDHKAASARIRALLAPLLGLALTEESADVMVSRFVAKQQPEKDRATDEELVRAYSAAYARAWESEVSTPDRGERAGLLAVAARVRQERCLVARAVAANVDVRVCEDNDGGFMVGVHATGCDEELARCVPASDVPATLARLLGEVSR